MHSISLRTPNGLLGRSLASSMAPYLAGATLLHLLIFLLLLVLETGLAGKSSSTTTETPIWIEMDQPSAQRIVIQDSSAPINSSAQKPERPSALSDRNQSVSQQMRASNRSGPLSRYGALNGLAKPNVRKELQEALSREKAWSTGGVGGFDDDTIPVGAETLLNTEQTVYYSFYSRLYQAIAPIWQNRVQQQAEGVRFQRAFERPITIAPGRYTTRIAVKLDSQGNLTELRILQQSPIALFDQVVLDSWRKVRQFPNPPAGLKDSQGNVQTLWSFTVEIGEGSTWQLLPPRRI